MECDICGKTFNTEHGLRVHQARGHGIKGASRQPGYRRGGGQQPVPSTRKPPVATRKPKAPTISDALNETVGLPALPILVDQRRVLGDGVIVTVRIVGDLFAIDDATRARLIDMVADLRHALGNEAA